MSGYSWAVIPFQGIMTLYLIRMLAYKGIPLFTFVLISVALIVDMMAMFYSELFPLSSFLIVCALLRFYEKSWYQKLGILAMNALMLFAYHGVPMGSEFITAVNYFVAFAVMASNTENEIYLKNVVYYGAAKHFAIAAHYWSPYKWAGYMPYVFSALVIYYMLRASWYYYLKGVLDGQGET